MNQDQENTSKQEQSQFPEDIKSKSSKKTIIISIVVLALAIVSGTIGYSLYQNSKLDSPDQPRPNYLVQKQNESSAQQQLLLKFDSFKKSINQQLGRISQQAKSTQKSNPKLEQGILQINQAIDNIRNSNNNNNATHAAKVIKLEQLINQSNQRLISQIKQLEQNRDSKPNAPFALTSIDIWNSKPQATIQWGAKQSIVDIGDKRLGWKISDIDFDKEQIQITNNKQQLILEMIR